MAGQPGTPKPPGNPPPLPRDPDQPPPRREPPAPMPVPPVEPPPTPANAREFARWARPGLIAALALAGMLTGAGGARAGWYCDPLHAYYPAVPSCPVPWQSVNELSPSEQPGPRPPVAAATPPAQPSKSGAPAAQPAADQGDLPTFTPSASLTRGDALDEWCRGKTTALNIAVCSDDELRALAIERLRAFDEARGRLDAGQMKELAADQNGWAMSYPQSCGLHSTAPPPLPLDPTMRDCLAKAGRARLTYLRIYGTASAPANNLPATQTAPMPSASGVAPDAEATAKTAANGASSPPRPAPGQLAPAAQSPASQAQTTKQPTTPPPPTSQVPVAQASVSPPAAPVTAEAPHSMQPKQESPNPVSADNAKLWRNAMAVGAMLIALGCVGLWVLGGLLRGRGRRDKAATPRA